MTTASDLLGIGQAAMKIALDVIASRDPGRVTLKSDRDIASEVDYAVENQLREFLANETPHIGFLGEEEGESDDRETLWVLDPVDGTANFVRGLPLYAVSLALVEDGQPVVGLISLPAISLHYTATQHGGARCNGETIRSRPTASLQDAMVSLGDYAVGDDATEKNVDRLAITSRLAERVERIRMVGSAAADLAWVAHGKLDATVILANKPWDTAAGSLLVREAGALVVDRHGEPHSLTSTSTVALSPELYGDLLPLLHD
ncbi:inositol monophosphatase family protein [Pseudonocardia kongjuensis]|uniref:Inositol-1-monophosphatase n=1 Tax=Pseudonocardia kongjuensis TaxID=102227 RepID=A0ABP4IP84_9PSEU